MHQRLVHDEKQVTGTGGCPTSTSTAHPESTPAPEETVPPGQAATAADNRSRVRKREAETHQDPGDAAQEDSGPDHIGQEPLASATEEDKAPPPAQVPGTKRMRGRTRQGNLSSSGLRRSPRNHRPPENVDNRRVKVFPPKTPRQKPGGG